MIERVKVSWGLTIHLIDCLVERIKADNNGLFDGIYGIPRGGMVIAVLLSHRLNLPFLKESEVTKNTLIVDDISDTGETLLKEVTKSQTVATLFRNKDTRFIPKFVGHLMNVKCWLVFPWEVD